MWDQKSRPTECNSQSINKKIGNHLKSPCEGHLRKNFNSFLESKVLISLIAGCIKDGMFFVVIVT